MISARADINNGESFTQGNIETLKLGKSLKPLRAGKSSPDIVAEDGNFIGLVGDESIEKSDEKLKLISKMEKEMKAAAARLDFERAAQIRDRIYQLENPTN